MRTYEELKEELRQRGITVECQRKDDEGEDCIVVTKHGRKNGNPLVFLTCIAAKWAFAEDINALATAIHFEARHGFDRYRHPPEKFGQEAARAMIEFAKARCDRSAKTKA